MNYKTKSAGMCHSMCHLTLGVALHKSPYLYGFYGMCATCATYFIKLFNQYITVLVGHGAMGVASLNSLTKLRNLVSQASRVAQIAKHQGHI